MRGKKRMSKRVSTRKREKIDKKVREHHKQQRKENRKKKKVPSSVLMTQAHKEHLQQIKEDTEKRTQEYYAEQEKMCE